MGELGEGELEVEGCWDCEEGVEWWEGGWG